MDLSNFSTHLYIKYNLNKNAAWNFVIKWLINILYAYLFPKKEQNFNHEKRGI